MLNIHSFDEARAALEPYYAPSRPKDYVYTLDRMRELLAYIGNPQDTSEVIHIAGTSGKTSTAYYTSALLTAAGKKVGLTVSPHVVELNDRVQINGKPLSEKKFCSELTAFLHLVEASRLQPTYFELMLAFAFWEFQRQAVDIVVVEVGLGGLLDASNTVMRPDKICVITDIGLDHVQVLGSTVEEIAAQKAGIIQLHNTVFCMRQPDPILAVFQKTAAQKQADIHSITQLEDETLVSLPLFQQRNFQLARQVAQHALQRHGEVLSHAMQQKALAVRVPGRMETFHYQGKTVIIDGAHNEQKLDALMQSVAQVYPGQTLQLLVAFGQQPEALARIEGGLSALRPYAEDIITTQFGGADDAPHYGVEASIISALAQITQFHAVKSVPHPEKALQAALDGKHQIVVVTGSFYLLNHIRPLLQPK